MSERLRRDLLDIRIFCGRYFPFIVIPLSYVRIVTTNEVPTAAVDNKGTLAINPQWWFNLSAEARRFVAIHECLHVVLCHPFRQKGFDGTAFNFAADAKVNDAIRDAQVLGVEYRGGEVTLEKISTITGIPIEALNEMSVEEIAKELENSQLELVRDLLDREAKGEIVQEGDKSVGNEKSGELEREWKRILERARDFARQVGTMPACLERLVEEVLEVKPPWHLIVRFGVRNHAKQDSSFAWPSRRGDEYPGSYGYRYSVWCLIDTSGSIEDTLLKHFLGIVKFEAKRADVYAIPWDAEAYEVIKVTRPADVSRKIASNMRGGGGTVIKHALNKVLNLMRPGDAVIVLTDGAIYDAEDEETQRLFRKVAAKAGFAMLGYTHIPVNAPGFNKTLVRSNED